MSKRTENIIETCDFPLRNTVHRRVVPHPVVSPEDVARDLASIGLIVYANAFVGRNSDV